MKRERPDEASAGKVRQRARGREPEEVPLGREVVERLKSWCYL